MALNMKGDAFQLMEAVGVELGLVQWLANSGYEVVLTAKGLHFKNPETGIILGEVPITIQELIAIKKSTLPDDMMEALEVKLTVQIMALQKNKAPPKAKPSVMNLLPKQSTALSPDVLEPGGSQLWPKFPAGNMTTAPRVKLRDATQMYQPVFATSEDSRYYVVAGCAGLKVAARWSGDSLSVRFEGKDISKYAAKLAQAGLDKKQGAGSEYSSMHLACADQVQARKALGSMLLGVDCDFTTPYPDLSVIAGK